MTRSTKFLGFVGWRQEYMRGTWFRYGTRNQD